VKFSPSAKAGKSIGATALATVLCLLALSGCSGNEPASEVSDGSNIGNIWIDGTLERASFCGSVTNNMVGWREERAAELEARGDYEEAAELRKEIIELKGSGAC